MLIPFLNHYYDYMKYSIIRLKKFSGTLKFSVLEFKLILNSLQNYSMIINMTQNFFMYTSIVEENCYGLD